MNLLQPVIFSFFPFNLKSKIQNEYNQKVKSEKFKFSDGGLTTIDYLYNDSKKKPFLYFTNTFGVNGFGMTYLYRIMLELNKEYNCIFIYSRGYKIPINNKNIYYTIDNNGLYKFMSTCS